MNRRNHTMHPAKALQAAVFAITDAQRGRTDYICRTDITVIMRGSWYIIFDGSTQYSPRNRQQAIDTIEKLLTSN